MTPEEASEKIAELQKVIAQIQASEGMRESEKMEAIRKVDAEVREYITLGGSHGTVSAVGNT